MEQDDELAAAKSRAHQLIGSNLLLFQRMERLLKAILPVATVSISHGTDVHAFTRERYAAVEKCTLGNLVNRLINEIYAQAAL